jgi:hypothetical protein
MPWGCQEQVPGQQISSFKDLANAFWDDNFRVMRKGGSSQLGSYREMSTTPELRAKLKGQPGGSITLAVLNMVLTFSG